MNAFRALLQAAAFPAAGLLVALVLLWIERALWGCDADDYPEDRP